MFPFFGLSLAVLVIQGDRILLILGGQTIPGGFSPRSSLFFLLFLVAMGLSLLHCCLLRAMESSVAWTPPVVITPAT